MPLTVKLRLLGTFRELSNKTQISMKTKNSTVKGLILTLAKSLSAEDKHLLMDPELNDPRPNALILVNGKEINVLNGLESVLKDGDEVTLVPVSHGG